ncbi:UNVERIFIED_CONTAM: hypothetical protein NCL1_20740 [Trichonephila clavipes]
MARNGWCSERTCLYWLLACIGVLFFSTLSEGSFSFSKFLKPHTHTNRDVSTVHRAKHHANSTSSNRTIIIHLEGVDLHTNDLLVWRSTPSSNRTIIIHLEGVDLHTNDLLALTKEKGKIGSPCNESYFIIDDLPVVSSDGSSGEIEVNEALHAELSVASWHVCIRQQSKNGEWTHIGKYERYPSSYEKPDYGKK